MISFFRKLRWLTLGHKREDQINEELHFHLEEESESLEESGLSVEEARWAARRELGNLSAVREETHAVWTWTPLEQLFQDLRYAARTNLRNVGFTLVAALTLGLGIGANTAIYSFMDALLMRSLPVADPTSLVVLKWHLPANTSHRDSVVHNVSGHIDDDPKIGRTASIFPYPAFELLSKSKAFSTLFAYHPARKLNVMIQGQTEVLSGEYVSGGYFRGLALAPGAGRLIVSDDDRAGAPTVVVLSYALAQRRFGNAADAVGQPVRINNIPFTVIGLGPPSFSGVDPASPPDFYLPMHSDLLLNAVRNLGSGPEQPYFDEHYYWIEMMGRLRPGITMAQAQVVLKSTFARWVTATATKEVERKDLPQLLLTNGKGGLDNLRRTYSHPMYILLAMVGMILAIACANIANLLLVRATARRREIAVRLSMGAETGRILRQLLTESVLLAMLGGVFGIAFAIWGIKLLKLLLATQSNGFPLQAQLNWHVLSAAAGLTIITGLLFGLAPAIQATRVDAMPVLREARAGVHRSAGRLRISLSQILVVSQLAISLLLLLMAGLFVRTLSNLQSVETGFQRENVLVFKINAGQAGHRAPEILSFYSDLEKRFAAIPGVRSASMANSPPIGDGAWGWPVIPFGKEPPTDAPSGHGSGMDAAATRVLATGPEFFKTMEISLLAGRGFDERDRFGSPPVAIVNQAWVQANLEGRNPIGERVVSFRPRSTPQQMEIVGLAKNARYDDLTGSFPAIVYMAFEQNLNVPVEEMTFFLRMSGNPLDYARTVREIVHKADARIPVTNLTTQAQQIDQEIVPQIMFARLCTGFALLALVIACVGLYGTMSYTVARRTGEIGIRMALGAQRRAVILMVFRDVLVLTVGGLVIGLPAALGVAKLIGFLLYGVKPNDLQSVLAAVTILLCAALVAGYVPARNACRIDPMTAVRHE